MDLKKKLENIEYRLNHYQNLGYDTNKINKILENWKNNGDYNNLLEQHQKNRKTNAKRFVRNLIIIISIIGILSVAGFIVYKKSEFTVKFTFYNEVGRELDNVAVYLNGKKQGDFDEYTIKGKIGEKYKLRFKKIYRDDISKEYKITFPKTEKVYFDTYYKVRVYVIDSVVYGINKGDRWTPNSCTVRVQDQENKKNVYHKESYGKKYVDFGLTRGKYYISRTNTYDHPLNDTVIYVDGSKEIRLYDIH